MSISSRARRIGAVAMATALALGVGLTTAPAAAAATVTSAAAGSTCTVKAALPSRIVVNRDITVVPVKLSGCTGTLQSADASLYGASGIVDMLWWDGTRTEYLHVYDWDFIPGTYRLTDGGGYTQDYDPIRWAYTSTVIKYGASISVAPKRASGMTSIPVTVKRYDPDEYRNNGFVPFTAKTVTVYSSTSSKGPWKKAGVVRTNAQGKATLKIKTSGAKYYQAVTSDSAKVFGTKSAVRRG